MVTVGFYVMNDAQHVNKWWVTPLLRSLRRTWPGSTPAPWGSAHAPGTPHPSSAHLDLNTFCGISYVCVENSTSTFMYIPKNIAISHFLMSLFSPVGWFS